MKSALPITWFVPSAFARLAFGNDGPAALSGACSHVIGPIDATGNPMGFTCQDVGGSALLVWNAAQLNSDITINGGTRTVNFFPGNFTVSGSFNSNGPLAFIGGGIAVTGSITGSSVLVIAAPTTEPEIKTTLLGPAPGRITVANATYVQIGSTGKVTATSGNLVVAGNSVTNRGEIAASKGTVALTVGTKLDVGWSNVRWIEGANTGVAGGPVIVNWNSIKGTNVTMEAQRTGNLTSPITNRGMIESKGTITFVTGTPGLDAGGGVYIPGTFGMNNIGTLKASKVTLTAYGTSPFDGKPTARTFDLSNATDRQELQSGIQGIVTQPDNTPVTTTAATLDAGRSFTVTSDIVLPQLAPSLTHLNAASNQTRPMLVASKREPEQVRGDTSKHSTSTKPKARTKAKPVLVRGAFFNSKISATVAHNP